MDKLSIRTELDIKEIDSKTAVKEFIDINTQLESLISKVNSLLEKRKLKEAFSYSKSLKKLDDRLDELAKRMPKDLKISDIFIKEKFKEYSNNISNLISENEKIILVETTINKAASEYVIKQIRERMDRETNYDESGNIHHSNIYNNSPSLGLNNKI